MNSDEGQKQFDVENVPPKKRKNRSSRYIVSKTGSIFYSFSLPLFSFKLLPPTKKVSNFQRMFLTGPHFRKLVTQFIDYFSSQQSWPTRELLHKRFRYTALILGCVVRQSYRHIYQKGIDIKPCSYQIFYKCILTVIFFCLKRNAYRLTHSLMKNASGIWMGLLFDIAKCCLKLDVEKMSEIDRQFFNNSFLLTASAL